MFSAFNGPPGLPPPFQPSGSGQRGGTRAVAIRPTPPEGPAAMMASNAPPAATAAAAPTSANGGSSPARRGPARRGPGRRHQSGSRDVAREDGSWRSATSPSPPPVPAAAAKLSGKSASAAVFVPKSTSTPADSTAASVASLSLAGAAARAAVFNPASKTKGNETPDSYEAEPDLFDPTYAGPMPEEEESYAPEQAYNPYEGQEYVDMYSQQQAAAAKIRQPLQYHQYAPPLPHVSNLHPHHLASHAFFLHPSQQEELQRKQEAIHANIPPPELGGPNLPEELHVYHSLVPLEPTTPQGVGQPGFPLSANLLDPTLDASAIGINANGNPGIMGNQGDPSKLFGFRSHTYKAVCSLDGKTYVLKRLEGFKLQHEVAISLVERWRRIRHPSVVSVREAFTTRAFGDSSIVFVFDYHPIAVTLHAEHMVPKPPQPDRRTGRLQMVSLQVPEKTLWSYVCQLANALRCIHKAGLAARSIEPSKVLRTGQNRVRLNGCSIFDVIAYDPRAAPNAIQTQQADDLVNLGKLMLSVACNTPAAPANVPRSLEQITRLYSPELKSMIMWLLQKPHAKKDADELVRLLAGRMADEFDSALNYNDSLESSLMRELENARLVRLLCKLGFINERPEFDHDPRWSETGDRYVVKLFRDFVFHSVNEQGRPLVDLSHILTNLNKLDAGSDEKIMLTSRDGQSCLVASYRDIKNCIESAFQDLSRTR